MLEAQEVFIYLFNKRSIICYFIKSEYQFLVKAAKWLKEVFCWPIIHVTSLKWVKGAYVLAFLKLL